MSNEKPVSPSDKLSQARIGGLRKQLAETEAQLDAANKSLAHMTELYEASEGVQPLRQTIHAYPPMRDLLFRGFVWGLGFAFALSGCSAATKYLLLVLDGLGVTHGL